MCKTVPPPTLPLVPPVVSALPSHNPRRTDWRHAEMQMAQFGTAPTAAVVVCSVGAAYGGLVGRRIRLVDIVVT
jgi:hypothetical protein